MPRLLSPVRVVAATVVAALLLAVVPSALPAQQVAEDPAVAHRRLQDLVAYVEEQVVSRPRRFPGGGVVPDPTPRSWLHMGRELDAIPRELLSLEDRVDYDAIEHLVWERATAREGISYPALVRYHTTLPVTPDQLHDLGLREIERLRGETRGVMEAVGFDGTFEEFIVEVREDPRFFIADADLFVEAARRILARAREGLPELFTELPRTPLEIEVVESPGDPAAAYAPGRPGRRSAPGTILLNTDQVLTRPLYGLEALMLHEGVPGHHLQKMLQLENDELPRFRRQLSVTAFVEGWALYAESLGADLGLYGDPHSEFGRINSRMWRACRLVVDTGLHDEGWTRQQAIDFMEAHLALSRREIEIEVDRYLENPGQALAYMIGALTLDGLRADAEAALGEAFDLRAFHDEVLRHGAIPLNTLVEVVQAWVEEQVSRGAMADRPGDREGGAGPTHALRLGRRDAGWALVGSR